nr:pyrimidine reductase family protein [Amycolatopsis nigrescens]
MRYIWPGEPHDVDDAELESLYRYPADPRWLAVNFVSSADGAVEIDGRSAGLSNPADRKVYELGSDLADVLLIGAGTATIEDWRGVHPDEETAERRERHGLSPVPPVAIVSTGRSLPPDAPAITEAVTPTIVITSGSAPPATRQAWADAGASVLVAGDETVDLPAAVDELVHRGLGRIDCEGGPRLFGALLAAGVVDELRLTISPLLVSGAAERIALGAGLDPTALRAESVLAEGDTLLVRYLLARKQG